MTRFKIVRNNTKEKKQLLQAKLDASLVEEVNLLCKWSGNEKNFVIAELLRYALSQENDFQEYKQSLVQAAAAAIPAAVSAAAKKEASSERKSATPTAVIAS